MSTVEERLVELGLSVPEVPTPVAVYVPAPSCPVTWSSPPASCR